MNGHKRMVSYNVICFDSFEAEDIRKEIKKLIGNKNIITINRIQGYDSIVWEYFCIESINFLFKDKILLDFTTFFSPNDYKKSDKIILKYFQ